MRNGSRRHAVPRRHQFCVTTLIASVAIAGSAIAPASHAGDENSVELGVSYLSFRYAEFPDDVRLRNKETGLLPGINAAIRFSPGNWRIGFSGSVHDGAVDYNGATSAFRPHQTQTETTIFNGVGTVGYKFSLAKSIGFTPYAGIGYRYWRRDIQPNNGVRGLLENYRWFYGALGLEGNWLKSEHLSFGADVRIIRPFNAELEVKLSPEVTLDLVPRTGYRLGFPVRWASGGRFGVTLEPYFEHQELGASAPKNGFLEPSSDTDVFGLNLSARFLF